MRNYSTVQNWLVCLIVSGLPLLGAPTFAQETQVFSNASVIEMVKAGLSDELVGAKIKQVPVVSFKIEVEDLLALKREGVSEPIIKLMLERSSSPAQAAGESASAPTTGQSGAPMTVLQEQLAYQREELGIDTVGVALQTTEGLQKIRILRSEISTTAMGFMAFMDYPGIKAKIRTHDRRPTLLVRSATALTGGRYFLVRLDPDTDDGVRSLKISSYKNRLKTMFGNSRGWSEPDHDWTLEWSAEEAGDEMWKVTPNADLEPGEYGWYMDLGSGIQQAGIFDFAVD